MLIFLNVINATNLTNLSDLTSELGKPRLFPGAVSYSVRVGWGLD